MMRDYTDILLVIVVITLLLAQSVSINVRSTVKALTSSQDQIVQNGNIQNHIRQITHFKIDKSQYEKAPEFTGITGYINTSHPIKLTDLKGKVVLVHFWTYTCTNCIHTIPHLNDWYQKYSNKGLGVQTPEFDHEKKIDNVKAAVHSFQIKYPVLQDNNYATWNAYENNYWPRDYLVDNQGYVRYNHIGEGGYSQIEQMIQSLLAEGVIT